MNSSPNSSTASKKQKSDVSRATHDGTKSSKTTISFADVAAALPKPQHKGNTRKEQSPKAKTQLVPKASQSREESPSSPTRRVEQSLEVSHDQFRFLDQVSQLSDIHPYRNALYIKNHCTVAKCTFCWHLFNNVVVTRCGSHPEYPCTVDRPCIPIGIYPHVGRAMWRMSLRKPHLSGAKCNVSARIGSLENWRISLGQRISEQPGSRGPKRPRLPSISDSNDGSIRSSITSGILDVPNAPENDQLTTSGDMSWGDQSLEYAREIGEIPRSPTT